MKLIETIVSASGKPYDIYKERGSITGTNLFFARQIGDDKGQWYKTQADAHKVIRKGWFKDPATGNPIEVVASK